MRVEAALCQHLRLHIEAYGPRRIKPKHRWQIDAASQIRKDGCILDAFIIERIHLTVKKIAEHARNTSRFERSVVSGVLNLQFQHAGAFSQNGLRGRAVPWPGAPRVLQACPGRADRAIAVKTRVSSRGLRQTPQLA